MNKLIWYYNRLKIMSIKEILFFRIPQFIQLNFIGKLQAKKELTPLNISDKIKLPKYSLSSIEKLFHINPLKENYSYFNTSINVLTASSWRKDYNTNIESPLAYYNSIEKQDFDKNGDVKFVAEVSRLHFMPFLAFKYAESNDDLYIERIEEVIENWTLQNPYLHSINWTSGIEVAIRSVNLIYTHYILYNFDGLSQNADLEIRKHITYNYQFLKNHLSLYSSANNHLMAELMGLNVISSYFETSNSEINKWRTLFYEQIERQVNSDGVHMELCSRYHTEVLDQIIVGLNFIKRSGGQVPETIENRVEKMFQFTQHISYCGIDTIFGDNDEGHVINPYFEANNSLYLSQLSTSNYLFNSDYKALKALDFRNYLIFGEDFCAKEGEALPQTTFFKDSGYCFMYDHNSQVKLSFDIGKLGDDISSAHGHSDIFHFTLQQANSMFLVDPGTYQYHQKETFWRNYFRGISAHNTISINKQNHALINNRMSWLERPSRPKTEYYEDNLEIRCKSVHTAFKSEDVVHERTIILNKKSKRIKVLDTLRSNNLEIKELDFYLHFSPEIEIEKNENKLNLISRNSKIKIENKYINMTTLEVGDFTKPFGWFSKGYNSKVQSKSLNLNLEMKDELSLETMFYYE